MALTTYSGLTKAVGDWLNRTDLAWDIPDFIALAEARIQRLMRTEVTLVPISGANPSPVLLLEAPDLYLYGALCEAAPFLEHDERIPVWEARFMKAVAEYNEYKRSSSAAVAPTNYSNLITVVDNWLNVLSLSTRVPEFIALAEAKIKRLARSEITLTPLSTGSPTSTLLTEAPDLYVYGALLEAAPYLKNDDRVAMWEAKFTKALDEYNAYKRATSTAVAVSNYANLVTVVDNWLGVLNLSTRIPEFIALADADIKRKARRAVVRTALETTGLGVSEQALPADCQELRSYTIIGQTPASKNQPLELVTPLIVYERRSWHSVAGCPRVGAVVGSTLLFDRVTDADYPVEMIYFQAHTPLTANAPTNVNSILTNHPDIYLYGTLLHAAPYLGRDERVPMWQAKFDSALKSLNEQREREENTGDLRPARLPVVF